MTIDVRALGGQLASLAWVAVRSFVSTVLVVTLAGVVLAGLSYYFLREYHPGYRALVVSLALAESVTAGVVLGFKRAAVMALAQGLGKLRLGRALVRLIFERMLGVAGDAERGERGGGRVTRGLERVPLAQADQMLSSAVRQVTGDAEQQGWLRRLLQRRLLSAIRTCTLARFRDEGAAHGGVDLSRVKDELERTVDDALVQKVRGGLRVWTLLVILVLPILVAVQTWATLMMLRS